MKKKTLYIILSLLLLASCAGDSYRDHVRRGNRNYEAAADTLCEDSTFIFEAATEYERAIAKDSMQAVAHYNAGNAYLLTCKDSAAFQEYLKADSLESAPMRQAHIHRNIGVLLQNKSLNSPDSVKYKMLEGAVANYKASLRYDPKNDETRYNLALCQWQLKKNQQNQDNGGGGGNGQDQQQQQDEQQEKKDDQKQEQKQQQEQQQQQQQQQASEQMIQAAMQREKETQNRMNQYRQMENADEQQEAMPRRLQKNW